MASLLPYDPGASIIPMASQLFDVCLQAYQMFVDIKGMPAHLEFCRLRLDLEKSRLQDWGRQVGYIEGCSTPNQPPANVNHIQASDILYKTHKVLEGCLTSRQSNLDVILGGTSGSKHGLYTFVRLAKKIAWEMIDKERFESSVKQLIRLNDSIVSLLDTHTVRQLYRIQLSSELQLLQLSEKVDRVLRLSEALAMHGDANSSRDRSDDLSDLAAFKANVTQMEDTSHRRPSPLSFSNLTIIDLAASRSRASLLVAGQSSEEVWVEWKPYDDDTPPKDIVTLESRISKLSNLLRSEKQDSSYADGYVPYQVPSSLRAPECRGYVHDNQTRGRSRFGLVYQIPGIYGQSAVPVNLRYILQHPEVFPKPPLNQRFALAHQMAESLMYLHAVNWIHKGVCSRNIVFLLESDERPPLDYSQPSPYVCGFEYSRPDKQEEATERPMIDPELEIYRHPASADSTQRSQKAWDIYSLGIVLVEIVSWQLIESKLDLDLRLSDISQDKIQSEILKPSFRQGLLAEAGSKFEQAVIRCVRGGEALGLQPGQKDSEPKVGVELLKMFHELVVEKLGEIAV